jgi:hypothetical protein
MLLREADVVHCSTNDLAALSLDEAAVRAALRPAAVLVVTSAAGAAWATGPFGEVGERAMATPAGRTGQAVVAAVCSELARRGEPGDERPDVWHRALRRAHASASGAAP